MVETNEVHLVLMDIMMPKLDGIQAMIRIREKSNVPVILLTPRVRIPTRYWDLRRSG